MQITHLLSLLVLAFLAFTFAFALAFSCNIDINFVSFQDRTFLAPVLVAEGAGAIADVGEDGEREADDETRAADADQGVPQRARCTVKRLFLKILALHFYSTIWEFRHADINREIAEDLSWL